MTRGRPPSLTTRGRIVAAGGLGLIALGALLGSPEVAALGIAQIATVMVLYLRFFPASVFVWRRHLELAWTLDRPTGDAGFFVGRAARLRIALRNRSPRALGRAELRVIASSTLEVTPTSPGAETLETLLPAGSEIEVTAQVVARRIGTWHLHGAALRLGDALGLFTVEAYFPSSRAFQVLPRPRPLALDALVGGGASERHGRNASRARGSSGETRELREHVPGDPWKQIAWKATARTGKLMVREVDTSTLVTHHLLVDQGTTMRHGRVGQTRLDVAAEWCAGYAQAALAAGDRVGLLTFDGRIVSEIRPNDGPAHRRRLTAPLLEAMSPIDEDLTDLTYSELVVQVARYLLFQEGTESRVRRAPPLDDPSWPNLVSSGAGELYDLRAVLAAVDRALAGSASRGALAGASPTVRLRQFCRLRGIELEPRRGDEAGRRARGLAAAIEQAARGRGAQRIVIVSDLEDLELGFDDVARAVRLVRRRGHQLVCVVPSPPVADVPLAELRELVAWADARRARAAWRRIAALGVRVIPIGASGASAVAPGDTGALAA
jgi:uncharacterized protein (DUF58 family)